MFHDMADESKKRIDWKTNLPELLPDLVNANWDAEIETRGLEDGGSCNSDAVGFIFSRMPSKRAKEMIHGTLMSAGLAHVTSPPDFRKKYGLTYLRVCPSNVGGQGARWARGVEVMHDSLARRGWDMFIDYQID